MPETKTIQCIKCQKPIQVGKFASVKQKCAECSNPRQKLVRSPRQKLERAQKVLDELEYTLADNGEYSKTYSDANGVTYKIKPFFHKGATSDTKDFSLQAFQVTATHMVTIKPSASNIEESWADFQEKIPQCTHEDMHVIWNSLVGTVSDNMVEHQAVDKVKCSQCGKPTAEFFQVGVAPNKRMLCPACFGFPTRPIKDVRVQ